MVTCGVRRLKHSTADKIFGYCLPGENIALSFLSWPGWPAPSPGGRLPAWVTGSWSGWPAPGPGGRLLVRVASSRPRWPAPGPGSRLLARVADSWAGWPAPGPGGWVCLGGQVLELNLTTHHNSGGYILPYSADF